MRPKDPDYFPELLSRLYNARTELELRNSADKIADFIINSTLDKQYSPTPLFSVPDYD
jgi:hypothetical protein